MTEDLTTSGEPLRAPAFSWPGRRRSQEAAEQASRAAQEGLQRLQLRPRGDVEAMRNGDEQELLVEQIATEVSRRLRLEAAEAVTLLQTQRDAVAGMVEELRELLAELREELWPDAEEFDLQDADGYVVDNAPEARPVDLNRATLPELRALGMSETQAARVIRHRDHWGEFQAVDELDHVAGFAPEHREELKRHLVVDPEDD